MTLRKIINLSPLVDVLMIVIFWYIMMSNQTIESNQEAAQNELEVLRAGYEAEMEKKDAEYAGLTEELERLLSEHEGLLEDAELWQQVNDDLSKQLQALREENKTLGVMLEQSIGYVYIRLYDGLNKNRVIEVNYESELADKFLFSDNEEEYMEQRIRNVVLEYAQQEEKQRVAVIFLYEGSNSLYVDIVRIMNVLYNLRSEIGISVLTINMAE